MLPNINIATGIKNYVVMLDTDSNKLHDFSCAEEGVKATSINGWICKGDQILAKFAMPVLVTKDFVENCGAAGVGVTIVTRAINNYCRARKEFGYITNALANVPNELYKAISFEVNGHNDVAIRRTMNNGHLDASSNTSAEA